MLQTVLLSATLPESLALKAAEWMNDTAIQFRTTGGSDEQSAEQQISIPNYITQKVLIAAGAYSNASH